MQIGITVMGFVEMEGALYYSLNARFVATSGETGEVTGTAAFSVTQPQAIAIIRQMITDAYGITVPANAQIKIVGL
jgi:hypothetical protein